MRSETQAELLEQYFLEHDAQLQKLKVTTEEYQQAVLALYQLAMTDCGGARCAATVLLSLYDGDSWQVDLADVCCTLDADYFQHVITTMKGRGMLMKEPHQLLEQGEARFKQLADEWRFFGRTCQGLAL